MPTEEEFNAIMAMTIKATTRVNDSVTKQQADTVLKWANKVLDQKARARATAREYNKSNIEKHREYNREWARKKKLLSNDNKGE